MSNGFRQIREFASDQSGAVLIWVSVMLLVIFSIVALAMDGSRYLSLNSNMQQIADAAALAGAKQLDGSASAITNATNAAKDYLKNNPQWSDINSGGTTEIADVKFYDKPPADDGSTTALSNNKIGNQTAAYIKVTTIQRGMTTTFAGALGQGDAYTEATAVAKVVYSVCRPIQSFLCNPWESNQSSGQLGSASNFGSPNVKVGDMFLLTAGTGASPGNWGFIDPDSSGKGTSSQIQLQNYWAAQAANSCQVIPVGQLGPWPDTGNDTGQKSVDGMNVRFDVPNTASGAVTNVRAPVVTDGFIIAPGTSSDASCKSTTLATPTYNSYVATPGVGKAKGTLAETTCTFDQVTTSSSTRYRDYCNARVPTQTVPAKPSCPGCKDTTTESCASFTSGSYNIGSCPLPRDPDMKADSPSWKVL